MCRVRPLAERFNEKWKRAPETGCHEWQGCLSKRGYAKISRGGVVAGVVLGSHVALELAGYQRPGPDYFALHRCDNPKCVNPNHLWWGTQAENVADMMAKGRGSPLRRKTLPCVECGSPFVRLPSRIKEPGPSFCSNSCRAYWFNRQRSLAAPEN